MLTPAAQMVGKSFNIRGKPSIMTSIRTVYPLPLPVIYTSGAAGKLTSEELNLLGLSADD